MIPGMVRRLSVLLLFLVAALPVFGIWKSLKTPYPEEAAE